MPHIMRVSVLNARAVCSVRHTLSESWRKEQGANGGLFIIPEQFTDSIEPHVIVTKCQQLGGSCAMRDF